MSGPSLDKLALHDRTRREILRRADCSPPLPELVVRALALLNDADAEPQQLETHLLHDQVLVGKILGMVNSPFYGLNRQISRVKDAIMVLGFRGLHTLLLTVSTASYLQRDYGCYGHSENGLWTHSLAVATGAQALGKLAGQGRDQCDELFIAGLLHDIGKMPVAPYLTERNIEMTRDPVESIGIEREEIGVDHTEAGALVCAKWNMSESVQEILRHHHDLESHEDLKISCAIVHLADELAHERGIGYPPDRAPIPRFRENDLEPLGLDSEWWENTKMAVGEEMDRALQSLASICG